MLKLQIAVSLAAATAVAVVVGVLVSQPWAVAQQPLHGISFAKGCDTPTVVGDKYRCHFEITNNLDQGPDTLTITSLVDVVHAHPVDVNSGNVLSTLTLGFTGGASCNATQTLCTLPPGSSIFTTAPLDFYTTDASDPSPLKDDALLIWQDTCSSGLQNCPNGDQTISTGSQSPLHTPTAPPSTSTPTATNTTVRSTTTPSGGREEPSNTPRAETATPRPNTPTAVSTVAQATVAPPRPVGVTALPSTGDGGSAGSGGVAGVIAGAATFGVLLAASRIRSMRAPR
jgi:hypothetical protein